MVVENTNTSVVETPAATVVETPAVVETPDTSTPAIPEYLTSFDYDGWDGNVEAIEEPYRPVFSKIATRIEGHRKHVDELTEFYKQMLSGESTVDFAKFQEVEKEYEKLKAAQAEKESEINNLRTQLTSMTEAEKARFEAERNAWITDFKTKNADIVNDEPKAKIFSAALEADFEIDDAVTLARSDAKLVEKATALRKEGVPSAKAVHFAKLELGVKANPVSPSASLVNGSDPANTSHVVRGPNVVDITKLSVEDARDAAVERASKRFNR